MAWPKIALPMLVLGSVIACNADVCAEANAPGPVRLAQAPAPPTPPAAPTPPAPPAASQPATPAAAQPSPQATDDPVGSVATLQGAASVTHNNATHPLALRDPIFKSDVLQTDVAGTLGVTFDDETTFTLRPNSRITVDEFVYQVGAANNSAVFNVLRGTVAFVAAEVARTGNMKIDTPTSSLGIRGTTGVVEVPADGAAGGAVSIKLYPDADGRVGRIEVFGRDGGQLGILSRGATGFAVRPGAPGAAQRFTAVALRISPQEAARDRSFVRQTFATRTVGREINVQRRTLQQQQRNLPRPNQLQPNLQRPPGQPLQRQRLPGTPPQPGLRTIPGAQPLPSPGSRPALAPQPGAPPALPQQPGVVPPNAPTLQQRPGAVPPNAPTLQQRPGTVPPKAPALQRRPAAPTTPSLPRAPGGQRKPTPQKKNGQNH
jgi:FecR-like protein